MRTKTKSIIQASASGKVGLVAIPDSRLELGGNLINKTIQQIFDKPGRWKKGGKRLTAEQLRNSAWERNNVI